MWLTAPYVISLEQLTSNNVAVQKFNEITKKLLNEEENNYIVVEVNEYKDDIVEVLKAMGYTVEINGSTLTISGWTIEEG